MSDEARAEAERRMQEQREQVGLMVVEQTRFVEGFAQGAEWQAERDADRIAELRTRVARLRAWKAAAMVVLSEWEATWEASGRPGELGASKAEGMRQEVERLQSKLAAVRALVEGSKCAAGCVGHSLDPLSLNAVLDEEAGS